MKQPSYRERDYAFGQKMLTLRSAIDLTQAGLAGYVGVSRRTVVDWEAGSKYPKRDHLQRFIELVLKLGAFPAGGEAEAIRSLWQTAHQKVLIDENWLAGLLPDTPFQRALTAPATESPQIAIASAPRLDWGDALSIPTFYGRRWELTTLEKWLIDERCKVVSVLGMGGIGKSSLVVSLMHQVAEQFEVVIWRSLRDAPTCETLLENCLQVLAPEALAQIATYSESRLSLLLEHLRTRRVLLVLDNLETILEEGEGVGRMRAGYEDYSRLLRRIAGTEHQSCLLLTSREKVVDLMAQEGNQAPVRALRLAQLDVNACKELLAEKRIGGSAAERAQLIDAYTGNPLALKIVAQTLIDLFDGEIAPFLEQGAVIFGGVRELLAEQFERLSALEQSLLLWLAIMREPATLDELRKAMVNPSPHVRLLEAIEALSRRSLIERGEKQGSFTLQSVVLEYATAQLIADVSDEVEAGSLARLFDHGLELAHAREYVRQAQDRLILTPILTTLRSRYRGQDKVEAALIALVDGLSQLPSHEHGYAPANLMALLRMMRGHLRGLDLSRLLIRGAYLQGVDMQDSRLTESTIYDSVFTETFDAMTAVAISPTGGYRVAASRHGEIRMWLAGGENVYRAWHAHAGMVYHLAFSPDERVLASGGWDGVLKLWDVESGALLWSGSHTSHINSAAFSPDGTMIASSSDDATLRLWDVESGAELYVLAHSSPVCGDGMTWSPDVTGLPDGVSLLASGDLDGVIRLWQISKTVAPICIRTIQAHTNWVDGLSFSPDGRTLASASFDGTVKLWDIPSLTLRQTLTGHTNRVFRVIWSPDGRKVASCSFDQTICLWDVAFNRYHAVLRGHTAGVVSIAFTPDSRSLLSGSEDGSLRVWDANSGQCLQIMQGYTTALYVVDWSPDGTKLVAGGSDAQVMIWDVGSGDLLTTLTGHHGVVISIAWSANAQWIASSEWDNTIRIWDAASGECLQILSYPDDAGNFFAGIAWSLDGARLASATYRHGVQVFDVKSQRYQWAGYSFPTWMRGVVWSLDGTVLASGGDNGVIYMWDAAQGTLLRRLKGHHGAIPCVVWSPDGSLLASGADSGGSTEAELFVWDGRLDGDHDAPLYRLSGHSRIVSALTWGRDERTLISGDWEGTLRWWDVAQEKQLWIRNAHDKAVQSLRRSPDGTMVASCGDDGTIRLWTSDSGEYLRTLRRDRPYERLNIRGIQGLSDLQKATLMALGAVED